jgi:hypothetical protein
MPLCFHLVFTDGRRLAFLHHVATLWHLYTVPPFLLFLYVSVLLFARKLQLKRSIKCIEKPTACVASDTFKYINIYIYTLLYISDWSKACLSTYITKFCIKFKKKKDNSYLDLKLNFNKIYSCGQRLNNAFSKVWEVKEKCYLHNSILHFSQSHKSIHHNNW